MASPSRVSVASGELQVHADLATAVRSIAAGTGVSPDSFWSSFACAVSAHAGTNKRLMARRDELQTAIDQWHKRNAGADFDRVAYVAFLKKIGYILPEPGHVGVTTQGVDPEVAHVAAPQLVVPCDNARYVVVGACYSACMAHGAWCRVQGL